MRLIYEKPARPQDLLRLAAGERKDSHDREVRSGETFEVTQARGQELLSLLPGEVRKAPADPQPPAKPTPDVKRTRRAETAKPSN